MIDRLRQLAIFAKTMDHGSFRGAAKELQLSPSVVSHHISQLEEHLGVALIYRSTRKLALTKDGEKLLIATHKMLNAVEGELQGVAASASEPSGELRITLPSVLSQSSIAKRIAKFSRAFPRIELILDFSDTRRDLISDRFDLAIRMGANPKNSATTRVLLNVKRKLVASNSYLVDKPLIREPNDLLKLDWLALAPVQKIPLVLTHNESQDAVINLEATLSTNDAQSLYYLAREDAGFAVVPEFLAEADVALGSMAFLLPEWELPSIGIFAEWPANAPKHGLIHLALDALS